MARFALLLGICALAYAKCYAPNGVDRNTLTPNQAEEYKPCNTTAEHSMCCAIGRSSSSGAPDTCESGGFCSNGALFWRESCTDPTWKSPSCIKLFVNGSGMAGTGEPLYDQGSQQPKNDIVITKCDNGSFCYGYDNRGCCRAGEGVFADGRSSTSSSSQGPTSTPTSQAPSSTAASASATAASASATAPAANSSASGSSGLSTGAKAGIGVGAAIGALLVFGLLFFLYSRRSKQARAGQVGQGYERGFQTPTAELATDSQSQAHGGRDLKDGHVYASRGAQEMSATRTHELP
ncbi:hypothetical protein CC86DRAFT_369295 [Ophiobolus disseminans]|uniref:Mid2 domain-containing protein n=1 Tax=Ophiobolus disseminans TaxID=1469910 RepID=A0A6A7A5X1_9PLEO|nr:hypothetical protein CC86DRAFT_369295 [Ophiobolus disseminans]